jgi:OHCU decarboxylase
LIEGLEQLNRASREDSASAFLSCCGSRRWAQKMTAARPFADIPALLKQAEEIWQNLETRDWFEAFAAHPKIGAKKAVPQATAQSAEWSQGEQSGTSSASDSERTDLEKLNRLYEEKFGFIFIVCATGKSAGEMLEICRRRLDNAADAEIRIAADEQRKITEIRLKKLLEGISK